MFSKIAKNFKIFNKSRGQTIVEYGLILVLSVMLVQLLLILNIALKII